MCLKVGLSRAKLMGFHQYGSNQIFWRKQKEEQNEETEKEQSDLQYI